MERATSLSARREASRIEPPVESFCFDFACGLNYQSLLNLRAFRDSSGDSCHCPVKSRPGWALLFF